MLSLSYIMISIIIPTYKEEKYIRDAILQFQDLSIPHEIIVTDDHSPDQTVAIAKSLSVKVLETENKHPTIAANRNAGARLASGDFLAFFDADSRVVDAGAFFARALGDFDTRKNLVAVTGAFWVSPPIASLADRCVYAIFNIVHYVKNDLLHVGEAPGKFQMIRREAFEKLHGFREDLVSREDGDMFQRLNKIGRTIADAKLIIYHSGRRSRAIGWPKLLYIWMRDSFSVAVSNKSRSKEWVAFR